MLKPVYPKAIDCGIFEELRRDVARLARERSPELRSGVVAKAYILPVTYISVWAVAMSNIHSQAVYLSCQAGMGVLIVMIYLNIIHDSVHHTIFRRRSMNEAFVHLFDLLGANSYIWRIRHTRFHHNYPNVQGWDTDLDQSPLVKVFPQASHRAWHRYQHLYLPLLYPLFLFNWLLVRDFKDFFDRSRAIHRFVRIPKREYLKLIVFKSAFLGYMWVLPVLVFGGGIGLVSTGFVTAIGTASILSLLVLLPPHANAGASFPEPDRHGMLPDSWLIHILKTTNDVDADNKITRHLFGAFHFHIAHHLFPNLNHALLPEATALLRQRADRYSLPYRKYPLLKSLRMHFLLLRRNSRPEDIFEETM